MSTMRNNIYPSEKSNTSKQVAAAAVRLAISADREEERSLIEAYKQSGTRGAAADFGGEYLESVATIIERAVVAARREGVISLDSRGRRSDRRSGSRSGHTVDE